MNDFFHFVRVVSTYSKFEVELQLDRSGIGTAECEPRNDGMNYFTSGKIIKDGSFLTEAIK